jgi:hypothetical protein
MMGIETMITYIQDNISQQLDLESANSVILRAAPAQMDGEDRDARTVLPLQHSSWITIYVGAHLPQQITYTVKQTTNAPLRTAQLISTSG